MLVDQRDALRAESLDAHQIEKRWRIERQQRVAFFKRSTLDRIS